VNMDAYYYLLKMHNSYLPISTAIILTTILCRFNKMGTKFHENENSCSDFEKLRDCIGNHLRNLPRFYEDLVVELSTLPEVGWMSTKNVNKLTQSGKVSLVIPCRGAAGLHAFHIC